MNITTDNPTNDYALYSLYGTVSNSASNLGTIKGLLGEGATFKLSGSTYQVNDSGYKVTLKTYGGSKKKVTVNKAKYGGYSYYVSTIGAKAFKNAKGKKITSLTLGSRVDSAGKQAFSGMTKLTVLNTRNALSFVSNPSAGKASGIKAGAFKNCGKASGAKLTIKCGWSSDKYKNGFKKALVKKGLSKKAKVIS